MSQTPTHCKTMQFIVVKLGTFVGCPVTGKHQCLGPAQLPAEQVTAEFVGCLHFTGRSNPCFLAGPIKVAHYYVYRLRGFTCCLHHCHCHCSQHGRQLPKGPYQLSSNSRLVKPGAGTPPDCKIQYCARKVATCTCVTINLSKLC